jgi:Fe2+ or Zn2+ uptake regulation protein
VRTLKGYEAIEIAEEYDLPLFDLDYRGEVTVEETKQFIASHRSPQSFALPNWPESDVEGEHLVMQAFHHLLLEKRHPEAKLEDVLATLEKTPIHPAAVELALERLVEQNRLNLLSVTKESITYQIPRTIYFKEEFLVQLDDLICEECAKLDLDGPFHQACLDTLTKFLGEGSFTLKDITEEVVGRNSSRSARIIRPNLDMQWLSKKASVAKSRWQSVIKPLFTRDDDLDDADDIHASPPTSKVPSPPTSAFESTPLASSTPAAVASPGTRSPLSSASAVHADGGGERKAVTKEDLIAYLRSIEILDEHGELARLQKERMGLLNRVDLREQEIRQLEKQKAYLEQQCQEMQRDLDTLVNAMQIAKRRTVPGEHVVDATLNQAASDSTAP